MFCSDILQIFFLYFMVILSAFLELSSDFLFVYSICTNKVLLNEGRNEVSIEPVSVTNAEKFNSMGQCILDYRNILVNFSLFSIGTWFSFGNGVHSESCGDRDQFLFFGGGLESCRKGCSG